MILLCVLFLVYFVGSLKYIFTGRYWEVSCDTVERFSCAIATELAVEMIFFLGWAIAKL